MDSNQKKQAEHVERMILRDIPSQVPFHCDRASYNRMLHHGKLFDPGNRSLWACEKTGARIHAKVTYRNIWNRDNTLDRAHVPVAVIYCSRCDKPPQVKADDPIWADEVQTLSC